MAAGIAWEFYRSFLSVLEEGSLSGAARALGLTQPTLGRHIAALETAFGITLFIRTRSGLMPTEAAQSLRAYAEDMAHTAAALERVGASQGEGVSGVVRITASDIVGAQVLPNIIAGLKAAHPQLNVELVISNRLQDLMSREADIAVRMVRPKQSQLIARSVGRIELGLYATPDYLACHGEPRSVAELAHHTLVGFDRPTAFLREAMKSLPALRREMFGLRSDSDLVQLALIRAGAGIGMCQVGLAGRAPRLTRILREQLSYYLDVWITMHGDLRHDRSCRATFDALVAGLIDYAALSSG